MAPSIVIHPSSSPVFIDSQQVLDQSIPHQPSILRPQSSLYAGNFMYIGTWGFIDRFKHVETRHYLSSEN